MRSVHLTEVLALVRVLISTPHGARDGLCGQVFREAALADRLAKRNMPMAGCSDTGTLAGAIRNLASASLIDLDNPDHCACFEMVLRRLRTRPRNHHL